MTISKQIIELVKLKLVNSMSKVDIAKELQISLRTVQSIASGSRVLGCVQKVRKRMAKSNSIIKRAVKVLEKADTRVSASKIGNLLTDTISPTSIRRRLHSLGYRYKNVASKIVLSAAQKMTRCKIVKNWICEKIDMDLVVYSDECKFTLDGNDCTKTWVKNIRNRRRKRPFRGGSVMVWGCIDRDGLILLRKLDGTLTTAKYCAFLKDDVLPVLEDKFCRFWFQQDNARPHVSKSAKVFFAQNGVQLLEWPAYSPDLSPIEKVWSIIKENLYNGQQFSTKEDLWNKIEEISRNLHVQYPTLFKDLYRKQYENMCDILYNHGEFILK